MTLKNKHVLLGVTGGVAAYKSIELVRRLTELGAAVRVIMTEAAREFVTPLSLETASRNPVLTGLYDDPLSHIRLPEETDLLVIAPATANTIGKLANGIADDLLSTCFLSYRGPVIIAPAMNWRMYENDAVRKNLKTLADRGIVEIEPESGPLACGEEGKGRLADVHVIVEAVVRALHEKNLAGRRVVVTAGPTREYLDPVRFLSNRSSGKMGYAVALAARDRGADVTLISGPTALPRPRGVEFIQVETAEEMLKSVQKSVRRCDLAVMTAAVADYRPAEKRGKKVEKREGLSLRFAKTEDVLTWVAGQRRRPFIIGFAAETGDNLSRAESKMHSKGADMIVFNNVLEPGAGFDTDTNRVTILDRDGGRTRTELLPKREIADIILDRYLSITS